jgi:hypothetical protein
MVGRMHVACRKNVDVEKFYVNTHTHTHIYVYLYITGTAVAQWLRFCATNRKVAGSIPDGVIGFFR